MMKSKNILHVVNIYFVLPYFIGDQFDYFREKGYSLNVACSESEYLPAYAESKGFDYIETPVSRKFDPINDSLSIIRICRFIKRKKIGIVVGHTPKGALLGMVSAWLTGVPKRIYFRHGIVYETSHGIKRKILILLDRITSRLATKIVCVGHYVLKKSLEDRLGAAEKQLVLGAGTCGGIDTVTKFNPERIDLSRLNELKKKHKINEGDFVIGYCGRLVRDKGIVELLDAFLQIVEKRSAKLLLVGMFEERDALPMEVQETILHHPDIIYTGFVNEDIEYYYRMMSVFVLASYREGFGMSALEAQAMGVPALTTEDTGCGEAILNQETGMYVKRDASDIKEKIEAVMDGKSFPKCRSWVVENFDNRIIWKEIEKLY